MMRCLIVDDEVLVRELMEDNIRQVPFLNLIKSCRNALEAAAVLHQEPIDLIFLDIQMPQISGLEFLQTLKKPPLIILVTAYEQYALEGFNLQVVDYLLKPFGFKRFLKACNRAQDLFAMQTAVTPKKEETDHFFVHVEYTLVKILINEIDYVEGLKDYIKIHLSSTSKPVLTRMTMKSIEERLQPFSFIRTHKSYLVAANKITTVKRDFVCIRDQEIPIGESFKERVNQLLNLGS
ncbi:MULTISPECIES: LytR/AlgR family response regulator transcription factor [Olivibacter]|uniref:LytR/AlgR family response regulator transcription factor n=1 Tax=Olivibacter jilunii TaxID=985016 RepID=A0ABW6B008_9SPHI